MRKQLTVPKYEPDDIDRARFNREVKKSLDTFAALLSITREKALGGHDFWAEWHMNLVLQFMGSSGEETPGSLKIEYRELPENITKLLEIN